MVQGPVAEWLGKALQKLLQRFKSARDLKNLKIKAAHAAFMILKNASDAKEYYFSLRCFAKLSPHYWSMFPAVDTH